MKKAITLALAGLSTTAFGANLIGNSGFEIAPTGTPAKTYGAFIAQYNEGDVDSWETTATDGLIELWNSDTEGVDFDVVAYEGNTFAEINATQEATLFQDVVIGAGIGVDYLFAHRGRNGEDTMLFTIDYLGENGNDAAVEAYSLQVTSDNDAWRVHYGNEVFTTTTETAGVYRFSYQAVSTSGGNLKEGNFLDAFASGEGVADDYPGTGSFVAVPEPSSSALLILSSTAFLARRKRK
ncbi:PEP-CTERM sorting domain-containing protein [Rubritalea sp.]|uniref:PEP-CTERM sorting domain-containing protein n=1 Tax=Rubritalea sp. TaxID=2109375 RepID=UPI003EF830E0